MSYVGLLCFWACKQRFKDLRIQRFSIFRNRDIRQGMARVTQTWARRKYLFLNYPPCEIFLYTLFFRRNWWPGRFIILSWKVRSYLKLFCYMDICVYTLFVFPDDGHYKAVRKFGLRGMRERNTAYYAKSRTTWFV